MLSSLIDRFGIILIILCTSLIVKIQAQGACNTGAFRKYCICSTSNSRYECSNPPGPKIFMNYDSLAQVLKVADENATSEDIPGLPEDFFTESTAAEKTNKLQWLSISTGSLTTIDSKMIGGCGTLERLDIVASKEFYSFSSDILEDCTLLVMLIIEDTQLASLPDISSANDCRLQRLLLVNNRITDVLESFIMKCSQKLTMLDLSFNRLTSIPENFLSDSKELKSLNLAGNLLRTLPARFLQECQELQELSLSSNHLQEIPIDIFPEHDSYLRFLYLRNNSLMYWPLGLLSNINYLEELDLSFNKLATLSIGSFGNCPRLRQLNLESNAIQNLTPGLLDNCTDLYEINLKHNHIVTLPENFLSICPSLTAISLDDNVLETIPPKFMQNCPKIEYVGVSRNKLVTIESHLFLDSKRLRTVKLNKNALVYLPDGLTAKTTSLQILDVSENRLDKVSAIQMMVADIKPQGTVYNLSFNELDELLMGTFQFASLPEELDLSHNNISLLQEGWSIGLQSLEILDMSYNKLTSLSTRQLMLLDNLHKLNLMHNAIINVETDAFVHLVNLVYFDLSHNEFNFEEYYSPLIPDKLVTLNVSHNQLSHFPMTWIKLPTLKIVDISHNYIMQNDLTRLLLEYPKNKKNHPQIYIAGNKIHCNCEILEVVQKTKTKMDIKDLSNEECMLKENATNAACSNINGCPKECQCGRNEDGATFVDCKEPRLQVLPSREPFIVTMLDISDSNISDTQSLCDSSWRNLTHLMASNAFYTEESTELMQTICHHHLVSLTVLDLSMNNITALPDNFLFGLNSLNSLNLSQNAFSNFPMNFFENSTMMKILDLSFANITYINKKMFAGLINLVRLYLSGNNIRIVPADTFLPLTSLTQLFLDNNSIEFIFDQTFNRLRNLTLLDLDTNQLNMSKIFELPTSLVVLRLSNNNITGDLQGMKLPSQMTTLDIRNNLLKKLTINAADFENIFLNFHLETNQIEEIFLNVSQVNHNRKTMIKLYLVQNPIICDCAITNLIKLVSHKSIEFQMNNTLFIVIDDAVCQRPIFLKGKFLNELPIDDLLCEGDPSSCPAECWCYNNKTNGVILDCHKKPMKSLPVKIPRDVRVLYINELNKSVTSLEPLGQPQWSNVTELWMRDCCQNMPKQNLTFLDRLDNLDVVDIDDNCKCKTSENVRFSKSGVPGSCPLQLPPPLCKKDDDNEWIWRECTGSFSPPAYLESPMCYVRCQNCSCYLNSEFELVMNCSNRKMTDLPSWGPTNVTVLDMNNNRLSQLNGLTNWTKLTTLYVRNNTLTDLLDSSLPVKVKYIDLRNNKLKKPTGWLDKFLSTESTNYEPSLDLANNTWHCDCEPSPSFNQGISKKLTDYVLDINITNCKTTYGSKPLLQGFLCPTISERLSLVIGVSVGVITLSAIIIATIVYFWQAKAIKIWLFAHRWCMCLIQEETLDDDKLFDAFISYSNEDASFVAETLLPGLESADDPGFCYKICIHERDWLGGGYIPQQIIESVQISRRTIIVLSEHFLRSTWANLEFKVAFEQALTDRINRLIVVIPGEVPPKDDMDVNLKMYITMNSYIRYKEGRFWDKLRYAMPHKVPGASVRRLAPEFIKMARQESDPTNKQNHLEFPKNLAC